MVGAGGHGRVVAEAATLAGWTVLGSMDSDDSRSIPGLPHLGDPILTGLPAGASAVIAVGDNRARWALAEQMGRRAGWAAVVHPAAVVSPSARVEPGAVIMAGAIVQAGATVGAHAILNTGSRVDHDCAVGPSAHVAPGAVLAGAVTLGEGVLVGAGSVVHPGLRLGDWCVLGVGGAAVHDLAAGIVYAGVPARPLKAGAPEVS